MFSSRLPPLAPNAFGRAVSRARASGRALFDLATTNPTTVGLDAPADLLAPLADDRGRTYAPDPRGLESARAAAAAEFARAGVDASPERVILTPGTSDAYALLFKLLCDPGDVVLVPAPSYPLFDLLTRFEGVVGQPYRLEREHRWRIDRADVERRLDDRVRAVLVVSPNNPTGSMVQREERDWLAGLCSERGIAVIADEVFADYRLEPDADAVSLAGESRALTFALGGLSKSAGMPQVKVAWTLVSGPDDAVDGALSRLDLLCDTYLGVSTPAQLALPSLIESGRTMRLAIARRIRRNLTAVQTAARAYPGVDVYAPEGGWAVVLRVPAVEPEEALVLRLLDEADVVVHPGFFFDFESEAFLVSSLLPEPRMFDEGVARLLASLRGAR